MSHQMDLDNTVIGHTPANDVVHAVVMTARLQQVSAGDLTLFTTEQWHQLFYEAFGGAHGDIRAAIIAKLLAPARAIPGS